MFLEIRQVKIKSRWFEKQHRFCCRFLSKNRWKIDPTIVKNDVGSKNAAEIDKHVFLSTFFEGNDAPGPQKSVRGMSQGPPSDSPAGFFGASWLHLRGLCGCPRPFQGSETPQRAERGALRRSGTQFCINFWKLGEIFRPFLLSLFDASLDQHLEQNIQHTMHNTQRHTTHDTSNWIHTSNNIDVHIHDKTRGGKHITHATCNLHRRQYETWGGVSIVG